MKLSHILVSCLPMLARISRIIPLSCIQPCGHQLGALFAILPLRDVTRCRQHLQRAYPDAEYDWIKKTSSRCFQHFFTMGIMSLRMVHSDTRKLARGVHIEGIDNARACINAHHRGEGTVLMSGHFGHWELQSHFLSLLVSLSVIGKRINNPALNDFVVNTLRQKHANIGYIYQDQGLLPCIRALRHGECIGMIPDQDLPKIPGIFSSWYGIPAYTPDGPAKLARSQKVAMQPNFLYYRNGQFVFHWGPRVTFERSDDAAADIQRMTDYCMHYQEQLVRRFPWQWVWWHRRWRTQPDNNSTPQSDHTPEKSSS